MDKDDIIVFLFLLYLCISFLALLGLATEWWFGREAYAWVCR